jgi:hypothetical protein
MDERDDTPAADGCPPPDEEGPDRVLTIEDLVISDDEPVDNIFVEKQQRLLTETLYTSWRGPGKGQTFLAMSNVGLFPELKQTPIVPDVMLAVGVPVGRDPSRKENNSYFVWIMGKPPDVVLEIVSDRRGGEEGHKMARYGRIGVPYYVIFDPEEWLGGGVLRSFERQDDGTYQPLAAHWYPTVKLGMKLWEGEYEDLPARWLRWCDARGRLLRTGAELAGAAKRQVGAARRRAQEERRRCEEERRLREEASRRLARMEAQMRALGIEPGP